MANQRAKNKESLSGWVDASIATEVKRLALEHKIPISKALEMLLKEGMAVHKKLQDNKR